MTSEMRTDTRRRPPRRPPRGSRWRQQALASAINPAFQDAGFTPGPDCRYQDSSVRRRTTQSYLETVDWTDPRELGRFLRVAERLLNGWEPQGLSHFHQSLRRDDYQIDEQTCQITPVGPQLSIESIARQADPSDIREGFERIRRAISDDPALAVGSAKELIESTAKVVLTERGQPFDDKSDLHGPATARVGLGSRHAHLAVNAALTWCELMLDTLADPEAPWRTGQS
jgi:abortive infection Abi-like protein